MAEDDLTSNRLDGLSWEPENYVGNLETIHAKAVEHVGNAANWYQTHRESKKQASTILRGTAIVFTGLGGLIPLLAQMRLFQNDTGAPWLEPGWAAVAVLIAGVLISLDYFKDYSGAWMRYMDAQLNITKALTDFEYDWQVLRAGWSQNAPALPEVVATVEQVKRFVSSVDQIVLNETKQWIEAFSNWLKSADEAARVKLQAVNPGGINLTVTNGDAAGEWELRIDGGAAQRKTGRTVALEGLTTGVHRLTATGRIDGATKTSEVAVQVPPGGVVNLQITLE